MKKGLYIVFEGIVGSGKTTQSKILAERLRKEFPRKEIVWTREPGGTEIGGTIRRLVQATEFEEAMDPVCEAYLYAAARAQTLRNVVEPTLKRGGIVIADRSYLTSVAFQGAGRNLGTDFILKINEVAVDGMIPDLVYYLDVPPKTGLKRAGSRAGDKFENMELAFFERVQKGYHQAKLKFGKKWIDINGSRSVADINADIYSSVITRLAGI